MADEIRTEYDVNVGRDVHAPDNVEVTTPPAARVAVEPRRETREERRARRDREHVSIVSHSMLFYWWPIWVFGYIFAALTWINGAVVQIGQAPPEYIHPNNGIGLLYTMIIFLVILITSIQLRGLVSGIVIFGALFVAVLFAWMDVWDDILQILPHVSVHMNFGFYMILSTLTLIMWALAVFVFDRLTYWRVEAGQVTKEYLIGGGEKSYDTGGLILEERHDDLFRHWILGLGSGDLRMRVAGTMYELPNVLFANRKVTKIQKLIKRKPD